MAVHQEGITGKRSLPASLNPIPKQSQGAYLQTTLSLKPIDGKEVAFQNGIPVPSFEPQQRTMIPLGGEWMKQRFKADHDFSMSPRNEAWLKELEQREGTYLLGGQKDDWTSKKLPMPENNLNGEEAANAAETYEDGVWYMKTFEMNGYDSNQVYTLKALGVNYVADFWINGQWVGYHEGGFTPFAFDISPFLHEGDNEIRIRVDNPPWGSREDTIPAVEGTDFFNYTGIIQDLYVEETSSVHITRADIVPRSSDGTVDIRVVLDNRTKEEQRISLQGELYEADRQAPNYLSSPDASSIKGKQAAVDQPINGSVVLKPGEVRVVTYQVKVENPKLWSMETPNLYVAEFKITPSGDSNKEPIDQFDTQFGIRTLGVDKAHILLNDRSVFLAGIARHEEWPDTGRTASWDRIQKDLEQIKGQHANMVRTGHYPNQVYTYLLLDRMGLAAMSEIPLWQFETAHYEIQAQRKFADQMWREMVFSQYNRPSVLLWSTQNESKDVSLRLEYNKRLVDDLHQHYNDGRLTTQSAAADQPGFDDPSMAPLDVAGWTMYFGIFHGSTYYEGTRQFLEKAHEVYPDKPILNTEFGHWTGDADVDSPKQMETYSSTFQSLLEKSTLTPQGAANPNGYVAGIDFWIMYDWYVNHNKWIDTFGVYHMDRTKAKPVAAEIAKDYKQLTAFGGFAKGNANAARILWESGQPSGTADSKGVFKLTLNQAADLSAVSWLRIDTHDEQSQQGFKVTLTDSRNRQWSVMTHEILTYSRFPVYLPLWKAEGIDLSGIKAVTVHREGGSSLSVLKVSAVDDASETWTPYQP